MGSSLTHMITRMSGGIFHGEADRSHGTRCAGLPGWLHWGHASGDCFPSDATALTEALFTGCDYCVSFASFLTRRMPVQGCGEVRRNWPLPAHWAAGTPGPAPARPTPSSHQSVRFPSRATKAAACERRCMPSLVSSADT